LVVRAQRKRNHLPADLLVHVPVAVVCPAAVPADLVVVLPAGLAHVLVALGPVPRLAEEDQHVPVGRVPHQGQPARAEPTRQPHLALAQVEAAGCPAVFLRVLAAALLQNPMPASLQQDPVVVSLVELAAAVPVVDREVAD
jgi:hypothetical protein